MDELLDQEAIDNLLKQLEMQSLIPSIIEIKQAEIDKISDIVLRTETQIQFDYVNDLYVKPLDNLLKFYYHQKGKLPLHHNLGDLSVIEKINLLRRELLGLGFTNAQLLELVPKNKEEISIIVSAKKSGFRDDKMYNNATRLSQARDYLNSMDNKEEKQENSAKIA